MNQQLRVTPYKMPDYSWNELGNNKQVVDNAQEMKEEKSDIGDSVDALIQRYKDYI